MRRMMMNGARGVGGCHVTRCRLVSNRFSGSMFDIQGRVNPSFPLFDFGSCPRWRLMG